MSSKNVLCALFSCVLVAFCAPLVQGQATASFSGTISDKAGAVISGANVRVTSEATGLTRDVKTDDSGHYIVPLLPVGFYTLQVRAEGFGPAEQKDIRLQVDEQH